jgi:hypothetical protein
MKPMKNYLRGNKEMRRDVLILLCLLCITAYGETIPNSAAVDVNAAKLVRAVREGENWIHKVDSLYIRIEGEKTETVGTVKSANKNILEYAFDANRVRFLYEQPDSTSQTKIWDGNKLIVCEKALSPPQEKYTLAASPQANFEEFMARETAWPRSQPHSFWFDSRNVADFLCYYGEPGDFVLKGKRNYRGIECYELEFTPKDFRGILESENCGPEEDEQQQFGFIGQARGLADQSYRWLVGTGDNLLYGLIWLVSGKPNTEFWMSDYKQIQPGCRYPFTQGYAIYQNNDSNEPATASTSNLKVLDIRINEKLDDKLFKMELKEGVEVTDSRSGRAVRYTYKPEPPDLTGKALPEFDGIELKAGVEQIKNKPVLICFVDTDQRPSRHYIKQLSEKAKELEQKGIVIIAAQVSNADNKKLNQSPAENNSLQTGRIKGDEEKTLFKWGVKSLPWLILTDAKHVVLADGFGVDELNEKLKESTDRTQFPKEKSEVGKCGGIVQNEEGKPIEGVKVEVSWFDSPGHVTLAESTTDIQGRWQIQLPSNVEDVFDIGLDHSDYINYRTHRGEKPTMESLRASKAVIVMKRGLEVRGTVRDKDGKPIKNALILPHSYYATTAEGEAIEDSSTARSSADGTFILTGVEEGARELTVTAGGFAPQSVSINVTSKIKPVEVTMESGGTSSGRVLDEDGNPVQDAFICCRIWIMRERHIVSLTTRTDSNGYFKIEHTPLNGTLEFYIGKRGFPPYDGKINMQQDEPLEITMRRNEGKKPALLAGKSLPGFGNIKIDFSPNQAKDKAILVCFWDMQQRPSRQCVQELAKRAEQIKQKGISVAVIQATKVDEGKLNEWVKNNNIPFPAGQITSDEAKIKFDWGVKSLPWLILTDAKHIIKAEGLAIEELNEKIEEVREKQTAN